MKQVKGKYRRLEDGTPYRLPEDIKNDPNPTPPCPVTDDDIELTKVPKMDVSEFWKYDWHDGVINEDSKTQTGMETEEKERSHGPILDKFIQDGKEHEADQIKKNVQKMMKRGMLSEENEKAIQEKFLNKKEMEMVEDSKKWNDEKTDIKEEIARSEYVANLIKDTRNTLKEYKESMAKLSSDFKNKLDNIGKKSYVAPKCEVLEPDKAEEWRRHTPEGDLGVTDYSIPGNVGLSLRKHGWFVCHKDEAVALWESRYNEVKESQDALFKDKVKEYLNANTVNYVSTGEDEPVVFAEQVKENSFTDIVWRLNELHNRKNHDYGNAAHESYKEFGLISYIIRLNDKMKRLKSLTKPGAEQQVADEKIEDTLMDLAAYAIMAIESLHSDD